MRAQVANNVSAERLLEDLRARDIRLRVEGGDLRVSAPPGALTAELREVLRRRKSELLTCVQAGGAGSTPGTDVPLVRVPRNRELPLSFAQERMWVLNRMDPEGSPYRVELIFALRADVADLQRAWQALLARHEVLRTTYRLNDDGGLVQIIHEARRSELPVVDLSDVPEGERAREMRRRAREVVRMSFDLAQGPVWRILAFRLGDGLLGVVLCLHHIASDGWSINRLVSEFKVLCAGYGEGREPRLAPLPVQYADYAVWQRQWLRGERLERELAYWRERLSGMAPVLELPIDYPRPAVQTFNGAGHGLDLPRSLSESIIALGQRHRVTPFMTLLAVFKVLLYRYSGQSDIVVGVPIAGRDRAEVEHVQGLFLNTLLLRTEVSGDLRFSELLARVRETTLGAYAHQELPFEKLVEELHPQRDMSRNPLYQVTFNKPIVQPLNAETRQAGLEVSANDIVGMNADVQVDLSLTVHERSGRTTLGFGYSTALFRHETILRLAGHYERLLESIVADPGCRISELPLLSALEREQLLVDWNGAGEDYRVVVVHELFEECAARAPGALAVESESGLVSYGELNDRANRLAHHLRGLGVGPDVLVGLCVERGVEMMVGILGIVKAGGAYVPLDPEYPAERLSFMLEDAEAPVMVTQAGVLERLPETAARIVCVDRDWPVIEACSGENPEGSASAASLAYMIYTSGSTGRPKGVPITHGNLCNLVHWHQQAYEVTAADRATQIASPAFDASVWEIWPYLTAGASVHIPEEATRVDPARLVRWLIEQCITASFLPTPLAEAVLRETWPKDSALRVMLTGGDRLNQRPAQSLPFRLVNHYGPTENTVVSTCCEVQAGPGLAAPPIGRPLPNTRAYVVDQHLQPVPIGVSGELLVGGAQLSAGYWNRPELTAEKFVADPFDATGAGRLYRTGDLVRWLPDGNLEFVGRMDNQVKVRGFRIELGEIEAVLNQQPQVREAVVVVREDVPGDKRLVAYVVVEGGGVELIERLREQLRASLPDYMMPSAFVTLEGLPLTPNGKVDRKALPAPERMVSEAAYVSPRTPTEEILAGIWAEVLKVERVGVHENFFELGGHSLLATQVVSRVRQACGVELPLREVFAGPTVAYLSASIERLMEEQRGQAVSDELTWLAGSGATENRDEISL